MGKHNVSISLSDLVVGESSRTAKKVWGGGGLGGPDRTDVSVWDDRVEKWLDEGKSVLYQFAMEMKQGSDLPLSTTRYAHRQLLIGGLHFYKQLASRKGETLKLTVACKN